MVKNRNGKSSKGDLYPTANNFHRILVYRDGLSEGQFKEALEVEVKAIKMACATLEATYQPKITFVVCQKRHHTRFFAATPAGADRSGNLMAGFTVDTDVTHPTEYDFYVLSHAGLQGTSRPTHYRVLLDENKIGPDELQSLTYNLCCKKEAQENRQDVLTMQTCILGVLGRSP